MSKSIPKVNGSEAFHESYSVVRDALKADPNALFAARTIEIACGVKVCLDLVFMSNLYREASHNTDPDFPLVPTLDAHATEALMRLAIVCMDDLESRAESQLSSIEAMAVQS